MKRQPWHYRIARILGLRSRQETEAELRFHFEMRVRDYVRRGMSEEEAREAALSRLGDLDSAKEECAELDVRAHRRAHRFAWVRDFGRDLRHGLRLLRRSPGFAAITILTLSLGIGATTAVFSLTDAILLAPLPFSEPDRLVRIWETSPQGNPRNLVSAGNVVEWTQRSRSVESIGAHTSEFVAILNGSGEPEQVTVMEMQPAVAQALRVDALLGRIFVASDAINGNNTVTVLGHRIWQSHFGGDPEILGRTIRINDLSFTVIGVMPPGFAYPDRSIDLWFPLVNDAVDPNARTAHAYRVLGRLTPGMTLQQAQAEFSAMARAIAEEHPQPMEGWGANVRPLHADMTREVGSLFWVLFAGVGILLLIACGNLASLLLARAVARSGEMAVRGALGAGRSRVVRQLLAESLLLASIGGIGALFIAPLFLEGLKGMAPADIPLLARAGVNLRLFIAIGITTAGCAVLVGLAPALRLARSSLGSAWMRSSGERAHRILRTGLLGAQVALSVVLLVGAGLFVRSFRQLDAVQLGFDRANLATMTVRPAFVGYGSMEEQNELYDALFERIRTLPGVSGAAGTSQEIGATSGITFSFAIDGRIASNPTGREDPEELRAVTPGYFDVLDQRLLDGRAFNSGDHAQGSPVVILNRSLAEKHWPDGESPIGEQVSFRPGQTPWMEVVGVVEDVRLASPDQEPVPALYIPHPQRLWGWLSQIEVVARVAPGADVATVTNEMRGALLAIDPDLPPAAIGSAASAQAQNIARRSFAMTLATAFGLLALVLTAVGLYGVISYSIAQRRREIGVRIALGAQSRDVFSGILGRSFGLALAGGGVGLIVAVAASRMLESLLFGVSPLDAPTYGVTLGLVLIFALATAAIPASGAARTDPVQALKAE